MREEREAVRSRAAAQDGLLCCQGWRCAGRVHCELAVSARSHTRELNVPAEGTLCAERVR